MRYGLIGEKLGHSFSKEIHESLADYTYELIPIAPECLPAFLTQKNFSALNVTIPYKETVIPYLSEIADSAKKIGAVNTIVNRNGKLIGFNTDYAGFRYLLEHHHIALSGKKVLILGKGGAAKAVSAVAEDLGAKEILTVYYKPCPGTITYEEAKKNHLDAQIIFNATPIGMYPKTEATPLHPAVFPHLEAVVDVIYNPLRPQFIIEAAKLGIPAVGGLEMLIAQAKYAVEIFTGTTIADQKIDEIYQQMLLERTNLVLIGMSGSGKTTLGKALAETLHRDFIDTDAVITEKIGMTIAEYFRNYGEIAFRDIESEVIAQVSKETGKIISTGGGAVLRDINVDYLQQNGRLIWLKRATADLETGESRPLAQNAAAAATLYEKRKPIYEKAAQASINNDDTLEKVCDGLLHAFHTIL